MTLQDATIQPHVSGESNINGPKRLRVAVIPGDGIGVEVMVEGLRSLKTAAKRSVLLPSTQDDETD